MTQLEDGTWSFGGNPEGRSTIPAPHKFSRKLHEATGDEAAEAMVDWMNRTDEHFDELHREVAELRQTMRADFAELRQEMDVKFAQPS